MKALCASPHRCNQKWSARWLQRRNGSPACVLPLSRCPSILSSRFSSALAPRLE